MKNLLVLLFLILVNLPAIGQTVKFKKVALSDSAAMAVEMGNLAKDYLHQSKLENVEIGPKDLYKIQMLAGNYEASLKTIELLRKSSRIERNHPSYIQYELFSKAKMKQFNSGIKFQEAYQSLFRTYLVNCNDEQVYSVNIIFTTYDGVTQYTNRFETNYKNIPDTSLLLDDALALLNSYFLYYIYYVTEPIVFEEIKFDNNRRYLIKEEVIISPRDGAELSVITARKRNSDPLPTALVFTIYADGANMNQAVLAASKGYAGVVATSRGKRLSKDPIEPYKHEYKDVYAVIDWISQQAWSNGTVGMYGGSYNGFTQWASMKEKVHPALKTIVPSVSVAPGLDAPMENNVFYNFPYKWIPYVTNNKFLDNTTNFDRDRWSNLEKKWFESGKPFNKMDAIDGTLNELFQEWISHPSYDSYWQSMIPYKAEFAHIDIPILTTTGYYDDGQRGAMYYYLEHLKYNPEAEHYLLIGPYDHTGAQSASSADLRGYQIDSVATINIREELVFDWFDYILKGKEKPSILKDRVNFQIMGANKWMNKPFISEMSNDSLTFYLSSNRIDGHYTLDTKKPQDEGSLNLNVDFSDRINQSNLDYYPWPIIKDSIDLEDGLVFISERLEKETIICGSFTGKLKIKINKKDVDIAINLYELTSDGRYFHLSYYIGRASYAKNREQRELLIPNKMNTIGFDNTRIVSKNIDKGSQIVIVINANKNSFGQINYGTGRDVSSESIIDAAIPLKMSVDTKSKITLPIWIDQ